MATKIFPALVVLIFVAARSGGCSQCLHCDRPLASESNKGITAGYALSVNALHAIELHTCLPTYSSGQAFVHCLRAFALAQFLMPAEGHAAG